MKNKSLKNKVVEVLRLSKHLQGEHDQEKHNPHKKHGWIARDGSCETTFCSKVKNK